MCGIVGIHGNQNPEWIREMNRDIRHRGPDDSGVFESQIDNLSMGMQRLEIIDKSGGHQPMTSSCGHYTIIFNGEIFNSPELRRRLEKNGVIFKSHHSDTETILQSYIFDGEECLSRLNGMFAFAIFDNLKKTLFCARDRFGIKPFYYHIDSTHFAFSSELKALMSLPFVSRDLDFNSLYHYSSLMFIPGQSSIIKSIKKLPPAHHITYDLKTGKYTINRWWGISFGSDKYSHRETNALVYSALAKAVDRWALSDVPIACSLSGGLDSSAIAALLVKGGHNISTYTVGFSGEGEEKWSELPIAREVAEYLGTDHTEIIVDPIALLDDLPKMVWHLDEPYGGGLPSWSVFKLMSRDVKVGFSGTGGDEIFGDYIRWKNFEGRKMFARHNKTRFRKEYFNRHYYMRDSEKRSTVFQREILPDIDTSDYMYRTMQEYPNLSIRDRITRMDMETQLPNEFLLMTDRFSMAHSLEIRTPFLDHELVQAVFKLSSPTRTNYRPYKKILRDAVSTLLPESVLSAPKKGFVMPLSLWLKGPLRDMTEDLLSPVRLATQGIYKATFLKSYMAPHLRGEVDNTHIIWSALMFQLWHKNTLESPGQRKNVYVRS